MSDDYTPRTDQVRSHYVFDQSDRWDADRGLAFDRWLAAHDAEIRTAALEEAAVITEAQICPVYATDIEGGYLMAVAAAAAAIRAAKDGAQ